MVPGKGPVDPAKEGQPAQEGHDGTRVIDLSWPHTTVVSVNGYTLKDTYLGELKKINLPSVRDFVQLIQETGKGCVLYCHDIS